MCTKSVYGTTHDGASIKEAFESNSTNPSQFYMDLVKITKESQDLLERHQTQFKELMKFYEESQKILYDALVESGESIEHLMAEHAQEQERMKQEILQGIADAVGEDEDATEVVLQIRNQIYPRCMLYGKNSWFVQDTEVHRNLSPELQEKLARGLPLAYPGSRIAKMDEKSLLLENIKCPKYTHF